MENHQERPFTDLPRLDRSGLMDRPIIHLVPTPPSREPGPVKYQLATVCTNLLWNLSRKMIISLNW